MAYGSARVEWCVGGAEEEGWWGVCEAAVIVWGREGWLLMVVDFNLVVILNVGRMTLLCRRLMPAVIEYMVSCDLARRAQEEMFEMKSCY